MERPQSLSFRQAHSFLLNESKYDYFVLNSFMQPRNDYDLQTILCEDCVHSCLEIGKMKLKACHL